jgi:predicted regulator of Ras-like GTPase activity (Roadblock/LC7/MglB family)
VPFKTILKKLVEDVPHASGALLADWEGEAVEHHCSYDDYELKLLGAHKGIILNRMKDIQTDVSAGVVQDVVITTDTQVIVMGAAGPDYALVMTLDKEASIGLALFRMRQALKLLVKEIY